MSDKDINQMELKELKNEVQLLRDELAIMQRKYEDLFYNLDTENFSGRFLKGINSKVSSKDVESMISQTESEINTRISSVSGAVSSVRQTVNSLSSRVSNAEGVTSEFIQTAYGFTLDGDAVTFTGILYLTDNNKKKAFSIHHDESQDHPLIFIEARIPDTNGDYPPIIIGNQNSDGDTNVYIKDIGEENKPATRGWVADNFVAK